MREPLSEEDLQKRIWKAVKVLCPSAWLFHPVGSPYQQPGIPDLLICINGMLIAMELKLRHPGESLDHARERATALQRKQIKEINEAGGMADVVTSVAEGIALIGRALTSQRQTAQRTAAAER